MADMMHARGIAGMRRSISSTAEFGDYRCGPRIINETSRAAMGEMFEEPARAIARNAIVIAVGFTPLLVAPLVPYVTVGVFLASIMAISAVATLVVLPAVMSPLRKIVFRG
jgi:predicted RND superfamily exporter protein